MPELEVGLEFKVDRKLFLNACSVALDAIPARDIKPILQNFRIVAQGGLVTVEATDLEVAAKSQCPIEAMPLIEGVILMPAERVVRLLKELTDDIVHIEGNEDEAAIIAGKSRFNFPGQNPTEFPTIQDFPEGQFHEMDQAALANLIHAATFLAGKDDTTFTYSSVRWEVVGDKIRLVTTNGSGLALSEAKIGGQLELPVSEEAVQYPLVPIKAMKMLAGGLDLNCEIKAQIFLGKNEIQVKYGPNLLYSRLMEGRFPPYQNMIDGERNKGLTELRVNAESLARVVGQANCMTSPESKGLDLTFAKDELKIDASGMANKPGGAVVYLPIDYKSKPISLRISGDILYRTIRGCGSEDVILEFGEKSFLLISPAEKSEERNFLYACATMNEKKAKAA